MLCREGVESPPLEHLKGTQMWHLGTWFSGGLGSVGLMFAFDDIRKPFQPKQFCDSKNVPPLQEPLPCFLCNPSPCTPCMPWVRSVFAVAVWMMGFALICTDLRLGTAHLHCLLSSWVQSPGLQCSHGLTDGAALWVRGEYFWWIKKELNKTPSQISITYQ